MSFRFFRLARFALMALVLASAACGSSGSDDQAGSARAEAPPATLRLGYFPNLTHASAVVGVENGIFQRNLGSVKLEPKTFNAGPTAVESLFSGALDATFIGPNPAINAFAKSQGEAIRIISGATSGGAALVVKPGINTAADLEGKKVASPQLGNTQDVALRAWLKDQGLKTDVQGGGDVSIVPQENAQTLETFRQGQVDGAWVPEPWATRLVQEGEGKVLVDERSLWPDGRFVTTHLIVRTEFLEKHPDVVRNLLAGHVEATTFANSRPDEAKRIANEGIGRVAGKKLPDPVVDAAWANLAFTTDPIAISLRASADHATELGLLPKTDLDGIYDLEPLNALLRGAGQQEVRP